MDHAGRGSKSYPAGRYLDSDNLLAIKDLTLADSRYQVNGVIVAGFGQGSTAVIAGEHGSFDMPILDNIASQWPRNSPAITSPTRCSQARILHLKLR